MVLVTTAVAVIYGWIEGYVIRDEISPTGRAFTSYGHFSSYQLAVGLMLGLITMSFALIKSTQMFAKGSRYFLFACLGNYPFSWLVEDFTYFLFNPLDILSQHAWSTWFLGGVYVYNPWVPGLSIPKPEFFIPTWYFLAFAWFLGCQWYAHRCTVYDNLLKDEIGQQLLPKIPLAKKDEHAKPESATGVRTTVSSPEPPPKEKTPVTPPPAAPVERIAKPVEPELKGRSADAEAALQRMREKWLKIDREHVSSA